MYYTSTENTLHFTETNVFNAEQKSSKIQHQSKKGKKVYSDILGIIISQIMFKIFSCQLTPLTSL